MHLENADGGVMCRAQRPPSRWQRTSDVRQVTCARCRLLSGPQHAAGAGGRLERVAEHARRWAE